ncbi:Uncharacterized membrane protein [Photobacterium sp. SKA34]|uniref:manganese efflux pump MntP n=1 Tax=Photobacterium sp. SKA34 TaxID=121723 RepID=UPI00006ACB63|nr:manganese efflux pump [Photobacterium sp. SKA34]EAR54195.1 Uncharacterized membrane protein [Photobacterium sp. SKA34]
MSFLLALLFTLSSNLDNFVMGLTYGVKNEDIPLSSNIIISCITTFVTYLSMLFGQLITHLVPNKFSNELGSVIFILMGAWFIGLDLLKKQQIAKEKRHDLSIKGAIILGVLLSINNIGVGILGSITQLNIMLVVTLTFITGVWLTYAGNNLGDHVIGKVIGKYNDIISGTLLIGLGVLSLIFTF